MLRAESALRLLRRGRVSSVCGGPLRCMCGGPLRCMSRCALGRVSWHVCGHLCMCALACACARARACVHMRVRARDFGSVCGSSLLAGGGMRRTRTVRARTSSSGTAASRGDRRAHGRPAHLHTHQRGGSRLLGQLCDVRALRFSRQTNNVRTPRALHAAPALRAMQEHLVHSGRRGVTWHRHMLHSAGHIFGVVPS